MTTPPLTARTSAVLFGLRAAPKQFGAASFFKVLNLRTIVYVDGYNLYYSLLRRSPYKWLNLFSLFRDHVLDADTSELIELRFYTAPILASMSDDPESHRRQRIYWQALRKYCGTQVKIIEGKMISETKHLRLSKPVPGMPESAQVQVLSEKQTDVRLAVDMVSHALRGVVEQVVLCSNDSDFEPGLQSIREFAPDVRIGLVAPVLADSPRFVSNSLLKHAHWSKRISAQHLLQAQLPIKIPSTALRCPESWQVIQDLF